ncbi:MAG TPA: NADPH-dependent 7-cyano-7-deazaguanine reductase QueF [Deltaproteobacteria bacterium]|nr:NADPH-dependent 7-cyano-7-deazaguanine reductase QueF [Deltaproteobacteria bacterium]
MTDIPLGKHTPSPKGYDPTLLFPIARQRPAVEMYGFDLWRSYELAWLNAKGKPCIGILEMAYPRQSKNIVESKSLKLYLHGLSNMRLSSPKDVMSLIRSDVERVLDTPWLSLRICDGEHFDAAQWRTNPQGRCIDGADITVNQPEGIDPSILTTEDTAAQEVLYSNLFRAYCPITSQPDWASVIIDYTGPKIHEEALLQYICSYRDHEGFGEACCEQIYTDILKRCSPQKLRVSCLFTRRGGIDINPVRSTSDIDPEESRPCRLIRQ